jgi:hypothetical protein
MSTDVKEILPHEAESIHEFAIEGLIKGYSHIDLIDKIRENWMNASEEVVDKLIKRAVKTIREETLTDIDKIIPHHIEMYEIIYQEAEGLRNVSTKLRAMKAKERLVGLHRETNSIEIHNTINAEIEVDAQYDLSKLDKKEQKRLELLMKKIEDVGTKEVRNV